MSTEPVATNLDYADPDVRILHGDALQRLAELPDESVQCIITSPPFWGLRDYGTGTWSGGDEACDHTKPPSGGATKGLRLDGAGNRDGYGPDGQYSATCGKCGAQRVDQQIGLEETPDEWCSRLVAVFRECRRVLRDDGVMWLEVGDMYANSSTGGDTRSGFNARYFGTGEPGKNEATNAQLPPMPRMPDGLKPKDLIGAPWMLAFALRADGWFLRSENIWARPNPMPESVTDRPTKAHSTVFLLTKRGRYYYDADAIREGGPQVSPAMIESAGANARTVWSIATEPTPFAHFATFPQALVEKCLKAGTSERGACSACGTPWKRIVERTPMEVTPTAKRAAWQATDDHARTQVGGTMTKPPTSHTTGWEASCACNAGIRPCVALDPFMGSGTVGIVARRLGRHAIGVELNAEYIAIAASRLAQQSLLA